MTIPYVVTDNRQPVEIAATYIELTTDDRQSFRAGDHCWLAPGQTLELYGVSKQFGALFRVGPVPDKWGGATVLAPECKQNMLVFGGLKYFQRLPTLEEMQAGLADASREKAKVDAEREAAVRDLMK